MNIQNKNIKEIIIKDKDNNLVATITDDDYISHDDYIVEFIQDCYRCDHQD